MAGSRRAADPGRRRRRAGHARLSRLRPVAPRARRRRRVAGAAVRDRRSDLRRGERRVLSMLESGLVIELPRSIRTWPFASAASFARMSASTSRRLVMPRTLPSVSVSAYLADPGTLSAGRGFRQVHRGVACFEVPCQTSNVRSTHVLDMARRGQRPDGRRRSAMAYCSRCPHGGIPPDHFVIASVFEWETFPGDDTPRPFGIGGYYSCPTPGCECRGRWGADKDEEGGGGPGRR